MSKGMEIVSIEHLREIWENREDWYPRRSVSYENKLFFVGRPDILLSFIKEMIETDMCIVSWCCRNIHVINPVCLEKQYLCTTREVCNLHTAISMVLNVLDIPWMKNNWLMNMNLIDSIPKGDIFMRLGMLFSLDNDIRDFPLPTEGNKFTWGTTLSRFYSRSILELIDITMLIDYLGLKSSMLRFDHATVIERYLFDRIRTEEIRRRVFLIWVWLEMCNLPMEILRWEILTCEI